MGEDILICRCKEVTKDGVKRRTKAGMGLCQGKTCERLVAKIISEETGISMDKLLPSTKRIPVRPVKIGVIGGVDDE